MSHASLFRLLWLTLAAGFLLSACAASKPALVPDAAAPAARNGPARFPQTPEILGLEKAVIQDSRVQQILQRRPGTCIKLRQQDSHLSAYLVEQRDGKWFNVTNRLPAGDQAAMAAAVARAGEASSWKAVKVKGP